MRKPLTVAGAMLMAVLAGCGEEPAMLENKVEVPGPEATQNALETMPEGQRNAVFIRAIQDAGQECQHVESSERSGEHRGFPVWTANCVGGGRWTIVLGNDGTASVLNPNEAQLLEENQAAPEAK